MNIELRQWFFGDEEALIYLFDHYDRTSCNLHYPEPGTCSKDNANLIIRCMVDMGYNGNGFARAIVLDGRVVGHIQYTKHADIYDASCDVEIILLPEVCNRGVGSEAVRQMVEHAFHVDNYECMFAAMLDTNLAACRMVEKVGMHYCGIDSSYDSSTHGESSTKLIYGINRPRKALTSHGVEIKPWERRDIDALAYLYETVDGRYDDIENPIISSRRAMSMAEVEAKEPEVRHKQMLFSVCEMVDQWNIRERVGGDLYRAIVNDGEIVGLVSVAVQYGKLAINGLLGCMLMPEQCGKGIATKAVGLMLDEAFRLRALHRISAWVYKPNVASSRMLEKNGFQLEGIQKEAVLCEGVPTDYLAYGLMKKDWEARV